MPRLTRRTKQNCKLLKPVIDAVNGKYGGRDFRAVMLRRDFGTTSPRDLPEGYPSDEAFEKAARQIRSALTRWAEEWWPVYKGRRKRWLADSVNGERREEKRFFEEHLLVAREVNDLEASLFNLIFGVLFDLVNPEDLTDELVRSVMSDSSHISTLIREKLALPERLEIQRVLNVYKPFPVGILKAHSFPHYEETPNGVAFAVDPSRLKMGIPTLFVNFEACRMFDLLLRSPIPIGRCGDSECSVRGGRWFLDPSNSSKRFCDECQQRKKRRLISRSVARRIREKRTLEKPIKIELAQRAIAEFERRRRSGDWKQFVVDRITPELLRRKIKPIKTNFLTRRVDDGTLVEPKLNLKGGR